MRQERGLKKLKRDIHEEIRKFYDDYNGFSRYLSDAYRVRKKHIECRIREFYKLQEEFESRYY